jgi:hypothetical protein
MPAPGALAVFSSFSCESSTGDGTGTWDLRLDNATSSQQLQRYLDGIDDVSVAGAVCVFDSIAAGVHTVSLRHASDSHYKTIITRNADMIAMPLVTGDGAVFNSGLATLGATGVTASSAELTDISGLSAVVGLDVRGRIFASAVLNAESVDAVAKTGTWDLQVDGATVGMSVQHYLSGAADLDAILLEGLSGELDPGNHLLSARHAASAGSLRTFNATLMGIALSAAGGGVVTIPAVQIVSTTETETTSTTLTDVPDSQLVLSLLSPSEAFLASSYSQVGGSGSGIRYGSLDLTMDNASTTEEVIGFLSGTNDLDAGGIFGLTSELSAGAHRAFIRNATDDASKGIITTNISYVALGKCSEQVATPTPPPTVTPTPVPHRVTIDLGKTQASPGDTVDFTVCLPPIPRGYYVDMYLLVRAPSHKIYSLRYNGTLRTGIFPYLASITNLPNGICGIAFSKTVCPGAENGVYYAAVALVPAGTKFSLKNVIEYDYTTITITDHKASSNLFSGLLQLLLGRNPRNPAA